MVDQLNEPGILHADFTTLDGMVSYIFDMAKGNLLGNPGASITPSWHLVSTTGADALIVTPFEGDQSKDAVAMMIAGVMKAAPISRYVFVCEAWMAKSFEKKWDGRPVSQREDKVEALIVTGEEHGRSVMKTWEIVRDWDSGAVIELKPGFSTDEENTTAEGRFCNLLDGGDQ